MIKYSTAGLASILSVVIPIFVQLLLINNNSAENIETFYTGNIIASSVLITIPQYLWQAILGDKDNSNLKNGFYMMTLLYVLLILIIFSIFKEIVLVAILVPLIRSVILFQSSFLSRFKGTSTIILIDIIVLIPQFLVFWKADLLWYSTRLIFIYLVLVIILSIYGRKHFGKFDKVVVRNSLAYLPENFLTYFSGALEKFLFTKIQFFNFTEYALATKVIKPLSSISGSGGFWLAQFSESRKHQKSNYELKRSIIFNTITSGTLMIISLLFFETILDIIQKLKPEIIFPSNVKNIIKIMILSILPSSIFSILKRFLIASQRFKFSFKLNLYRSILYLGIISTAISTNISWLSKNWIYELQVAISYLMIISISLLLYIKKIQLDEV